MKKLILLLIVYSSSVFAQIIEIKGIILDEELEPVINAIITDTDNNFSALLMKKESFL